FGTSRDFARSARAFDPDLKLADLWQALRNVWIGNSLQMLLGQPLRLRAGLFGYSMLYPVTDNLLDDPAIAPAAQRAFNQRFGRRLTGQRVTPASAREGAAFRLVEQVEREFPRPRFPEVHESLLAIHHGQMRSLRQQGDPTLAEAEILDIACEK